jgi:hypothetical protein
LPKRENATRETSANKKQRDDAAAQMSPSGFCAAEDWDRRGFDTLMAVKMSRNL